VHAAQEAAHEGEPGAGPAPAAVWTRAQLTRQQNEPASKPGQLAEQAGVQGAVFSFLYFLKVKISKIYVRFEIFHKIPAARPP